MKTNRTSIRHFLVILGLTALVWLGVSMSDQRDYPIAVQLRFSGYDTSRYAVVQADSTLALRANLTGFNALLTSLFRQHPCIEVELAEGQHAKAVADMSNALRHCAIGAKQVHCGVDSVRIQLAARASRTYRPRIDQVQMSFNEQFGLYGEPTLTPSEVVLYGPQQALDSIDALQLAATSLKNIQRSDSYRLPLDPVWERFPDVHPSCREVTLTVPVEPYVERDYRVPISVLGADSSVTLKLYPEQATVRLWVAQRDLALDPMLQVAIDYADVLAGHDQVEPQWVSFPAHARPRSIEPPLIHCLILH